MEPLSSEDPRRLGSYTLLARLGHGGMGTVYLGHNARNELFAIKMLLAHLASDAKNRQRFRHEIDTAGKINSPYVIPVKDSNIRHTPPWFAMPFIEGLTLHEAVMETGSLPLETVIDVARDVALGLKAIHGKGFVHRDLKPSNIMLDHHAKIADLGIARVVDAAGITTTGTLVGTAAFMCPEQIRGGDPTAAWDVFALGGILTFAMTGQTPFGHARSDASSMMYSIMDNEPNLNGIDPRLESVIRGCLAKDPKQRMTIAQLLKRLSYTPTQVNQPAAMHIGPELYAALETRTAMVPRPKATQPKPPARQAPARRTPPSRAEERRARQTGGRKPVSAQSRAEARRKAQQTASASNAGKIWLGIIGVCILVAGYVADTTGALDKLADKLKGKPSQSVEPVASVFTPPDKLGQTYDPLVPKGIAKVTTVIPSAHSLEVRIQMSGYDGKKLTPLNNACIDTRDGKTQVWMKAYKSKVDKTEGGVTDGTLNFKLVNNGDMTFYPDCRLYKGTRGVKIGHSSIDLAGILRYNKQLLEVMSYQQGDGEVTALVPDYTSFDPTKMCLKRDDGTGIGVEKVVKIVRVGQAFNQVVFRGATSGVLYWSCESGTSTKFFGTGVKIG